MLSDNMAIYELSHRLSQGLPRSTKMVRFVNIFKRATKQRHIYSFHVHLTNKIPINTKIYQKELQET